MALFDINFPKLISGLGEFYMLVITSAIGSIIGLVIQNRYNELNKKSWKEWAKFILYTLRVSMIVSTGVLLVVWIISKLGLLIGGITI